MVTTNLSNGERPQGFSPPLIWCNPYYTQPSFDHTGFFLPVTFRRLSEINIFFIRLYEVLLNNPMTAFFPTRTSNLSYTRISTLHRKMDCLALPTVATLATRITYRLIPHRSVYYSIDKNCSFATHSS